MIQKALAWIKDHVIEGQGVAVSSQRRDAYPEVTGYLIPTLLSCGEHELAGRFALWLVDAQQTDGSFAPPQGRQGYAFDTGQVIRGWAAMLHRMPELETPLRRACHWIMETADSRTGRLAVPPSRSCWSLGKRGEVNEGIHLYALTPMLRAGEALNEPRYAQFVGKSRDYYLKNVNLTDFRQPNALTHFFAYIQEALLDLGCEDQARKGMASVAAYQQPNGAVPGYSDVKWVCSTGLAQLAQVWYRLMETQRADAAMKVLAALQNPSGGFFGSYGEGADYFPAVEIPWSAKYAIEAAQRQICGHFDQTVDIYKPTIPETDGRVQAILHHLGDLTGKRVLDAGCGKGRYASILKRRFPSAEITAMDISAAMLRHVPAGIRTVQHGILDMPFADGTFDAVICVETLEHVVHIEEGVKELVRILAPQGTLVVIDKNKDKLGALKTPTWEKWFGREELLETMMKNGLNAHAEFVGYNNVTQPDELFICWSGRKCGENNGRSSPNANGETVLRASLEEGRMDDQMSNLPATDATAAREERSSMVDGHVAVGGRTPEDRDRPISQKKILYYGAGWPTNIGNAFIDLGAMAALKRAFPQAKIGFASEMPRWFFGYRNRAQGGITSRHDFPGMDRAMDIGALVECDLVVFSGMAMCEEFVAVNGPTLMEIRRRGIPVILMGTGGCVYDDGEKRIFGDFLRRLEPVGFISRDDVSFETYRSAVKRAYKGVDCGFFLREAFEPFSLSLPPYVVANFDTMEEPSLPTHGRLLIRSHHNCWAAPESHYCRSHTLISDIPQDYLTLYANAEEVHTDRVHACVATLSYGRKARFYRATPRGSLFSVLGVEDMRNRPVCIDLDLLERKKQQQVEIVRELAANVFEKPGPKDGRGLDPNRSCLVGTGSAGRIRAIEPAARNEGTIVRDTQVTRHE